MNIFPIDDQYLTKGMGPLDAKALVKTYAELTQETTWVHDSVLTAYNGMLVAVWLNKKDTTKNGIYLLHDPNITGTLNIDKKLDYKNEANWHKIATLDEVNKLISQLESNIAANTNRLAGIEIDGSAVTVLEFINAKLASLPAPDLSEYAKIVDVETYITDLIKAADPDGGKTIENIQNLVSYVDENAGEIAGLITKTNKNEADIAAINDRVAQMLQPKASKEISIAEDGTLSILELNVNKLVQTEGEELVLSGGTAI